MWWDECRGQIGVECTILRWWSYWRLPQMDVEIVIYSNKHITDMLCDEMWSELRRVTGQLIDVAINVTFEGVNLTPKHTQTPTLEIKWLNIDACSINYQLNHLRRTYYDRYSSSPHKYHRAKTDYLNYAGTLNSEPFDRSARDTEEKWWQKKIYFDSVFGIRYTKSSKPHQSWMVGFWNYTVWKTFLR